mgnify:CR=1 FL=1
MDFFTVCIAITCMLALLCIAHLQDKIIKINNKLSDMKFMVNAYAERTDRVLNLTQDVLNNNHKMIEYIEVLENRINKED